MVVHMADMNWCCDWMDCFQGLNWRSRCVGFLVYLHNQPIFKSKWSTEVTSKLLLPRCAEKKPPWHGKWLRDCVNLTVWAVVQYWWIWSEDGDGVTVVSFQPVTVPELPAVLPLRRYCSPDKSEKKKKRHYNPLNAFCEFQVTYLHEIVQFSLCSYIPTHLMGWLHHAFTGSSWQVLFWEKPL